MPLALPPALVIEKNKLASTAPWVVLLDVVMLDETALYVTNNTEEVTFQGQLYTPFPFEIDMLDQDSKGNIPSLQITISNVTRYFQYWLESTSGMVGATVLITVVHMENLTEDYSELQMSFDVIAASADAKLITFTLGAPNPLRRQFPLLRCLARHCNWVRNYKGVECGYTGTQETCNGTYDQCKAYGNSRRFGGYIGLQQIGYRIV